MKLKNSSPTVALSNWLAEKFIRRAIRRERRRLANPADISLAVLWRRLYSNPLFRMAAAGTLDIFNLRGRDFVMSCCVRLLRKKKIVVSPGFFWKNPAAIRRILDDPRPVLIVTLHYGFAFATKTFSEAGRQVATIARSREEIDRTVYSVTKLASPVTVIARDKYCLGRLRQSVARNHILCCAVDRPDRTINRFSHISPALFAFSSRLDLPLYYADVFITAAGEAACSLIGPIPGSAAERLDMFLQHARSARPHADYKALAPSRNGV